MKRYELAPLCGVLLLALAACGCDRLKARDQLNKGVQAYRNAQFQPAIMHFKEAVRLDPSLLNARLYLATAYAQQYVPGGDSEDNKQIGSTGHRCLPGCVEVMIPATPTPSPASPRSITTKRSSTRRRITSRNGSRLNPTIPCLTTGLACWIGRICFPRAQTLRVDHNIDRPRTRPSEW